MAGESDGLDGYRQLAGELVSLLDESRYERTPSPSGRDSVPSTSTPETETATGEASRTARHPASLRLLDAAAFALPSELTTRFAAGEVLALDSERGVTLYVALPASGRVLALSPPSGAGEEIGLRVALTALFYGGIALLLLAWLLPLVGRLHALSASARAFGQGELGRRVRTSVTSNLHDIETEFNRMAARIRNLVEDNRLLGAAVSHDLRTPLARLRFGVEALAEEPPAALRQEYVRWLGEDVDSMEALVDVLLEFTRLDGSLDRAATSELALEPLIDDAVGHARTTGERELLWTGGAGHLVSAHEPQVRMLIRNLLQNAVRHAAVRVRVGLERHGGRILLVVEDDGPGIVPAERARVLEPFERGRPEEIGGDAREKARPDRDDRIGARSNHDGLGLAIVDRVAERHGATLAIGTSPLLGGARFEVGFPAARAA